MGYVYLLTLESGETKIGCSKSPVGRLRKATTLLPSPIKSVFIHNVGPLFKECEASLHRSFENSRVRGEWFRLDDIESAQSLLSPWTVDSIASIIRHEIDEDPEQLTPPPNPKFGLIGSYPFLSRLLGFDVGEKLILELTPSLNDRGIFVEVLDGDTMWSEAEDGSTVLGGVVFQLEGQRNG